MNFCEVPVVELTATAIQSGLKHLLCLAMIHVIHNPCEKLTTNFETTVYVIA